MPSALEHIKEEIKALRPAERYDLWHELSREFDPGQTWKMMKSPWRPLGMPK